MLLSWKYNFVFIHISKTGGTALSDALVPYARLRDRAAYGGVTPWIRIAAARLYGADRYIERMTGFKAHAGLTQLEDAFGPAAISPLLKVSFVRNPFSRAYSLYAHIKRTHNHPLRPSIAELSFHDAIPIMCEKGWTKQTTILRRRGEKNLGVDFLGAFERLDDDANTLTELIGLPRPLSVRRMNINPAPPPNLRQEFGHRLDDFIEDNLREFKVMGYSTDIARAGEPPQRPAVLQTRG